MMKKRTVSIVSLVIVLTSYALVFTGCRGKESVKVPQISQDIYVYDQEQCINDVVEDEINLMIKELKEKTEVEFIIVSVTSLGGQNIEECAYEMFNTLIIGKQGLDNGVLLLFSGADDRVWLETGSALKCCLDNVECQRILANKFVPYREDADYTKSARNTVIETINIIAEEYQVELENVGDAELTGGKENKFAMWVYMAIFLIMALMVIRPFKGASHNNSCNGKCCLSCEKTATNNK